MMRRDAVPLEALGACVHPRRPPDRGRRVFAPAPRPTAARAAGFTMMEVVLAVSLQVEGKSLMDEVVVCREGGDWKIHSVPVGIIDELSPEADE